MPPPCFSKAILYYDAPLPSIWVRASRVPQPHRYYQSTTTSCDEYGVAYVVRFPAPTVLSKFAPVRWRSPLRPGPVQARYRWLSSAGQSQELPGSWGIPPISLPRSQIPAGSSALTSPVRRCCPQARHAEDASTRRMSGFNYAASISAAYASSDALPHPHARLSSGRWLAFTGWESNPLDSIEKFLPVTPDLLLSQAYPGASLESSHPS
jgi:hypothetical protein